MVAEKNGIELKKAREELQKCKNEIKKGKPKKSYVADSVAAILTASDQNHWHRIKYFEGKVSSSRTIKLALMQQLTITNSFILLDERGNER